MRTLKNLLLYHNGKVITSGSLANKLGLSWRAMCLRMKRHPLCCGKISLPKSERPHTTKKHKLYKSPDGREKTGLEWAKCTVMTWVGQCDRFFKYGEESPDCYVKKGVLNKRQLASIDRSNVVRNKGNWDGLSDKCRNYNLS